ncbi:MAG: hypothetical protein ACREXU_18905 [Gammaproteobacteria bacterium]
MFDLHPGNQRAMSVSFTKADGSLGQVETAPAWSLSDPALATLAAAPDGMSATIAHNGAVGEVTLTVRADGDLGAGVHPIVLSEIFTLMAPLGAVGGAMSVGEEQPIG